MDGTTDITRSITFTSQNRIDVKKLNNAIKLACAEKFIYELPDNLSYMVGTHGRKISSGQKQRIVIARSFYDSREILVLDEATNALDEETEKKIIQNIQNDLFDLGGDLCFPVEEGEKEKKYPPLRMTDTQVLRLEKEIDEMNSHLEPLKSFILL